VRTEKDGESEISPPSNPPNRPGDNTEQRHFQSQRGARDVHAYRGQDHSKGTDPTTRRVPSTLFTTGTAKNDQTDVDFRSAFGKLQAESASIDESTLTPTQYGDTVQRYCQTSHRYVSYTTCNKTDRILRNGPAAPTPTTTAPPRQPSENLQRKRLSYEDLDRAEAHDPTEKAYEEFVSFLENQLKDCKAQLEKYKQQRKDPRGPPFTSDTLNKKLLLMKKVACMRQDRTKAWLALIDGAEKHEESSKGDQGKTRLLSGPFHDHQDFKRGSLIWVPVCQRALDPNVVPDHRRIPSPNGLIDDTRRMCVVIHVDRHNLRVCSITSRNRRGGQGLHNKASWGWIKAPHVPEADKPDGCQVFRVSQRHLASNADIWNTSVFQPELPFLLKPPANYEYVGHLDEESTARLPIQIGFGVNGELIEDQPRFSKRRDSPDNGGQDDYQPAKKQKLHHHPEAHQSSRSSAKPATGAKLSTDRDLMPPPSLPSQSDKSQDRRRNTPRNDHRSRDSRSVRGDLDSLGHNGSNDDRLDY
jgi:hypothetical protein